jgi:hypothetical protein
MHIAAFIQRENKQLFADFFNSYAQEHSLHIAQYMANTLQFWDSGRVEIQDSSLDRFAGVRFPDVSDEDKQWLIQELYVEHKANHPEEYHVNFRIDYNIDDKIKELNHLVDAFNSENYDLQLSSDFNDGVRWICQGDSAEARSVLYRYAHRVGRDNYASARPTVEEFLRKVKNGTLPIPFKQKIELLSGHIVLDYNYRMRKRMGDALKNLGRRLAVWR